MIALKLLGYVPSSSSMMEVNEFLFLKTSIVPYNTKYYWLYASFFLCNQQYTGMDTFPIKREYNKYSVVIFLLFTKLLLAVSRGNGAILVSSYNCSSVKSLKDEQELKKFHVTWHMVNAFFVKTLLFSPIHRNGFFLS